MTGEGLLWHVVIPDLAIAAATEHFMQLIWDVHNAAKGQIPDSEILLNDFRRTIFSVQEIPEVHISVLTCRNKAIVVIEPANGSDSGLMSSAREVRWAFACVKVENLGLDGSIGNCEEVATVAELNFPTSLNLQTFELMK